MARAPLGLRVRVPDRPHREPRARSVRRRRPCRRTHPGPVDLPQLAGRARHDGAVRLPAHGRHGALHASSCRPAPGCRSIASALVVWSSRGSTGSSPARTPTPSGRCTSRAGSPSSLPAHTAIGRPARAARRSRHPTGGHPMSIDVDIQPPLPDLVIAVAASLLLGFAAIRAVGRVDAEARRRSSPRPSAAETSARSPCRRVGALGRALERSSAPDRSRRRADGRPAGRPDPHRRRRRARRRSSPRTLPRHGRSWRRSRQSIKTAQPGPARQPRLSPPGPRRRGRATTTASTERRR